MKGCIWNELLSAETVLRKLLIGIGYTGTSDYEISSLEIALELIKEEIDYIEEN